MEDIDRRVKNFLVLASGFSVQNALITVTMFHEGGLTETEKEVITKIRRNPEEDSWGYTLYTVLNPLNHRITNKLGGDAKTPNRRKRTWA